MGETRLAEVLSVTKSHITDDPGESSPAGRGVTRTMSSASLNGYRPTGLVGGQAEAAERFHPETRYCAIGARIATLSAS